MFRFYRRGFIALHKLDKQRILTHEETRKKAKADREQLIGTLKTFTSLIFGLYEDKEQRNRRYHGRTAKGKNIRLR